jgi:hypothetical protein
MAFIDVVEAQSWAEQSKLSIASIDGGLEDSIATQVLAKIAAAYDTTAWTTSTSTPSLVRKVIAMQYVSWQISRAYAADDGENDYALRLLGMSESLIEGIISGAIPLTDLPSDQTAFSATAAFYPSDASSAMEPTADDRSLGGPAFTMGVIW